MTPGPRVGVGLGGAAAFLGAHALLGGLRWDHGWLALGGLAVWVAWPRWRGISAFFAPLLIMAAVYDTQRYWIEAVRGPIHVGDLLAAELRWFGIPTPEGAATPARWWQTHTHPVLDVLSGAAYLAYLPGFLAAAAWWRWGPAGRTPAARPIAARVMWAVMWLNLAAYATYAIFPAAPPWYVDRHGLGPVVLTAPPEAAGAARFDAFVGYPWFARFYARNANVFGAVPSLHVGQTFLAVLYAWRLRSLRVVATLSFAVMAFASVYLNHHYVIDGLAGMAFALAVFAVAERRRTQPAGAAGAINA